jgi:hypothetical protein
MDNEIEASLSPIGEGWACSEVTNDSELQNRYVSFLRNAVKLFEAL